MKLIGNELFDIIGLEDNLGPKINVLLKVQRVNGDTENIDLLCRIDTDGEAELSKWWNITLCIKTVSRLINLKYMYKENLRAI